MKYYSNKYKKIGRELPGYGTYGHKWEEEKESVMYDAIYHKFSQNEDLKEKLLSTGNKILVEASPYDKYWGVGLSSESESILNPKLRGQAFYMQVRIKQAKGDMSKLSSFISTFSTWGSNWGIKFEDIPDWADGLNRLVDAYGASFESAIVDAHKSALG